MRRLLSLLFVSLALSACKSSSSDTYVVLDFVGTVSSAAPIASISLDLDMGGEKSSTSFTAPGNAGITLPTDATLRIVHGSGDLQIFAAAKSADGQVLGKGMGRGPVVAGQTKHIEVRFGAVGDAGTVGSGQDAASDGISPIKGNDAAKNSPEVADKMPDGAAGSGGSGGGGMSGTGSDAGLVLVDGGPGGRSQDASSLSPDAPMGGAGGSSGLGGAGGASTSPGTARIVSDPSALDFATVGLGKPAGVRRTIIRNVGTAAAPALVVVLSPANGPFAIESENCAGKILGAGDSCTVNLVFKPSVTGTANGNLSVKAGSVGGTEVGLTGVGAASSTALTPQPTQGDFGPVNVGTRGSVVFTLSNTGASPATNLVVTNTGGPVFQINNDQCNSQVLQPNASCTFAVLFVPTAPGLANGAVSIKSPDVPSPLTVNLSGTGKSTNVTLTVNLLGNGVGIVSAPGLSCQGTVCTGQYDPAAGVSVTLNAKPDAYSSFAGWSGGPCNGAAVTCTFVLTGPTTTAAKFIADTAQVGLSALGLQGHTGTISSSDGILSCSGQCPPAPHPKTASMTLVATPAAGSTFVGWTEGPCRGANPTCTIPLNNDIFVSATFGPQAYMFVTSTSVVPGKLGGLAGADAECTARAQAGGLPGSYRAWLSATGIDAKARVGSGGWVRVDGRPFARNIATLTASGNPVVFYPPRVDEMGKDVGTGHVLVATGSNAEGASLGTPCGDYTSTTGALAVGDAIAGSTTWGYTQLVSNGCANSYRLYCFNTTVAGDLRPAPGPGKRVFISKSGWSPFGDISNADAFCRADAVAASMPNANSFVALLATSTAAASTRLLAGPWKRVDDVIVFRSPNEMASNILLATPGVLADGTYGDFVFWSGATGPGVVGLRTTSCQEWSSSSNTDHGQIGNANLSATPEWFAASSGNGDPCDSSGHRLLCVEP
jgi:hypothetical protein